MEQNRASEDYRLEDSEMLREVCYGAFEGYPSNSMITAIVDEMGTTLEALNQDPFIWIKSVDSIKRLDTTGMAKDAVAIKNRIQTKLREVAQSQARKGGNVLLAHSQSINIMLSDLDPDFNYTGTLLANAAVCKVLYADGKFTIQSFNDTGYIEAGKELR
jgi:probable phosphoglycerate mutase